MTARVEWGRGPDFAEVAEALRIPTDQIVGMLATEGSGDVTAMYSTGSGDAPPVYAARLRRDADGVLVPVGEHLHVPGFWEDAHKAIGDKLRDKFGEPQ
jgi:hypothetical protein